MTGWNSGKTVDELCGWLPLAILPLAAMLFAGSLPPWAFMWTLSLAIFFGLKWVTWWRERCKVSHPKWRSVAYLLAWPGMDADAFLDPSQNVFAPALKNWLWAFLETVLGIVLLWVVARSVPNREPLIRGWIGMVGLIFTLHFGLFQIVALVWQQFGVVAQPIMNAPLRATSLAEFWGKRWNLGFRQLAHELIFRPTHRFLGAGLAGFLVFLVSGLIHDLVISLPSRGGYGLPTLYFLIQGTGVMVERSRFGKSIGLTEGVRGWLFMTICLVAPVFWLFHPWFVMRVVIPFMGALHAI